MHGGREAPFTVHLAERALGRIAHYLCFITTDTLLGYDEWEGEKLCPRKWNKQCIFNKKTKENIH